MFWCADRTGTGLIYTKRKGGVANLDLMPAVRIVPAAFCFSLYNIS